MTSVNFKNLRLKKGCLIGFDNKQLDYRKTLKQYGSLSTLPVAASVRFFVDVNLLFSNSHFRRILLGHVTIHMSSMKCIEGYIVILKVFIY